jgi:acetylornithine aminotransferase
VSAKGESAPVSAPAERRVAGEAPLNPLLMGGGEYPFLKLARMREALLPPGVEPIDFSIGDPREETPEFIRDALRAAVPAVSSYPAVAGLPELRAACARWLGRRFGVRLDPETQILPANGTKEAVFLLAFAIAGRDAARDTIVIPTPAYPVYEAGARFAGAQAHFVPLSERDGFRFDPDSVPDDVWRRTSLLWLNYPHNPTGATLPREGFARVHERARRFGFWVASDEAYAETYFDAPPRSMLESGVDHVLALHTLSKRSAMTGYRSGFMAGDERLIAALKRFRPNVGVATPDFVQRAAIAAWNDDVHPVDLRERYAVKRELFLAALARRGWAIAASEATFYLWIRAARGDDVGLVERLMRAGLVALPGSFLGPGGEGFVRWALVPTLAKCREAIARLEAVENA